MQNDTAAMQDGMETPQDIKIELVAYVISEEDLASGPETRLDHRAPVWQKLYYSEKRPRTLLTQISGEKESTLLASLSKGAINLLN